MNVQIYSESFEIFDKLYIDYYVKIYPIKNKL